MSIPSGFRFSTAQCGFKRPGRSDLGLVVSDRPSVAAGVFTTNRFQAAPILVAQENLNAARTGIRALVMNSGQANACTGAEGLANCRATLDLLAALDLKAHEILPASTGVIGEHLKMDLWDKAMPALRNNLGQVGLVDVAQAIMTTDTFPKITTRTLRLSCGEVHVAGFCKGAGMICPDMATMLGFLLCDAAVEPQWWQQALTRCVVKSFNAITVDGDTSTNDCVFALANGSAGAVQTAELDALEEALLDLCQDLAYMIVQDAEGGTRVMRVRIAQAASVEDAQKAARAIGNSPLVKTALYGRDPNWGRIVAALGRSGADFTPEDVVVRIAGKIIFCQGTPVRADWDSLLASALRRDTVDIDVSLGAGQTETTLLASDFTEEYIKINAQYRT